MRKFISYLLILIFIFALNGCGNESDSKYGESDSAIINDDEFSDVPQGISLVIIAGKHSNANMFTDEMLDKLKGLIYKSFSFWYDETKEKQCAQGQISVIVSDGKPVQTPIMIDGKENNLSCYTNTEAARNKKVNDIVSDIIEFIKSDDLRAEDDEVDLMGAINEAQTILELTPSIENHILILDTGICTSGKVNMVRDTPLDIQTETAEQFVNSIPENAFPSLEGTKISFRGIGNVAEPQQDYRSNNDYKKWLVDVWTKIIEKCGGTLTSKILFSDSSGEPMMWYEDGTGYPRVKTVFFEDSSSSYEPENAPEKIVDVFKTASLTFIGDSVDFYDEQEAVRVIGTKAAEIKSYIESSPDSKIYVVGSIAKTGAAEKTTNGHWLSKGRAEKVKDILVNSYGIPDESLVVIDAGTAEFSWRPGGEYINGELNKYNQQSSRLVALISDNAAETEELRAEGFIK